MEGVRWPRAEINRYKRSPLRCDCCGYTKGGRRRRRGTPRYVLKALVQGKDVAHYPLHTAEPEYGYVKGLSRWKKTLHRQKIPFSRGLYLYSPEELVLRCW
jgi:hypothetical protein